MTPDSEKILEQLRQIKPLLKEKWGITRLRVFGSVARGEAGPDSDVDLMVEFDQPTGLMKFYGMRHMIEDELRRDVDLLTPGSVHQALKENIFSEAADV